MRSNDGLRNIVEKNREECTQKKDDFNCNKLFTELKEMYSSLCKVYGDILDRYHPGNEMLGTFINGIHDKYNVPSKYENDWNQNFCRKAAYLILNKVLILRICEDMGYIREDEGKYIYLLMEENLKDFLYILTGYWDHPKQESRNDCYTEFTSLCCAMVFNNIKQIYENLSPLKYDFKYAVELNILGSVYENFADADLRKSLGQYYTPGFVIDYILKSTVKKADIVENPYVKVLDPSCGSGNFLISAYDVLREKFLQNLKELRNRYADENYMLPAPGGTVKVKGSDYWQQSNIHYHIIKNCLYGADIDEFAIQLTAVNLLLKDFNKSTDCFNLVCCDSLIEWEKDVEEGNLVKSRFWRERFDYVIGNPPYIGHKNLSLEYKKWLFKNYSPVFCDKSDISYCFFYRALQVLKDEGICSFITSRYFMESPTGKNLRVYLKNKAKVLEIVDFYGAEVFKGTGVAAAIFTVSKKGGEVPHPVRVIKLKKDKIDCNIASKNFDIFNADENLMDDDRWLLLPGWKYSIYRKIEEKCGISLGNITSSFQGIITGCDKAFVMEKERANELNIEKDLLHSWIKNSDVERYSIRESNKCIIYSDFINGKDKYRNSIDHINLYRDRLEGRRECKKGIRKWYELQWGRDINLFLKEKIVFPYKSQHNKFAIDRWGNLCSADVYSFHLRENASNFSHEYLIGVLNSKIYEFYFKLFAKKMGSAMYDYYPNSVMQLRIPDMDMCPGIENNVKKILKIAEGQNIDITEANYEIERCEEDIDKILAYTFSLTRDELKSIYSEI